MLWNKQFPHLRMESGKFECISFFLCLFHFLHIPVSVDPLVGSFGSSSTLADLPIKFYGFSPNLSYTGILNPRSQWQRRYHAELYSTFSDHNFFVGNNNDLVYCGSKKK